MAGHGFYSANSRPQRAAASVAYPPADRSAAVEEFYRRLETALTEHPDAAAVGHVMSLRIRRRPRPRS